MKVLIVDDERKSRDSLHLLLSQHCPEVMVVGLAADIDEAGHYIREKNPEVVFLDIMMPGGSGFQLLERFAPVPFHVIFTTSYNQYAIKAIRFSAIDYLLKPVVTEELKEAVKKAGMRTNEHQRDQRIELLRKIISDGTNKIALPTMDGFHLVATDEIEFCEADNNYTRIHLVGRSEILISKTLKDVENLLGEIGFFRIHQSFLVNLKFIRKFVRSTSALVTDSGKELPVSSRRKEEFVKILRRF